MGISEQASRDRSQYSSNVLPMTNFPLLDDPPKAAAGPFGKKA